MDGNQETEYEPKIFTVEEFKELVDKFDKSVRVRYTPAVSGHYVEILNAYETLYLTYKDTLHNAKLAFEEIHDLDEFLEKMGLMKLYEDQIFGEDLDV